MPAVAPKGTVAGVQIWAKPLGGGKTAALFINGGATEYTASISLKELNITGERFSYTRIHSDGFLTHSQLPNRSLCVFTPLLQCTHFDRNTHPMGYWQAPPRR